MEVKIGVQHSPRELVVESQESADAIEKIVADAVASEGIITLSDAKGRKLIVPAGKLAYVQIGGDVVGQVGFRG